MNQLPPYSTINKAKPTNRNWSREVILKESEFIVEEMLRKLLILFSEGNKIMKKQTKIISLGVLGKKYPIGILKIGLYHMKTKIDVFLGAILMHFLAPLSLNQ
eukprot:GHVP01048967.1.p1 GENE.GHVP01048967.1~~GHVP01048967.1.p1  ORF type:complete len:103 (-),score=17.60 GHVP01048967.1:7-315(-)